MSECMLFALRRVKLYGPGSCAQIAKAAKVDRQWLYRQIYLLQQSGHVVNAGAMYGLTFKGEQLYAAQNNRPLFT